MRLPVLRYALIMFAGATLVSCRDNAIPFAPATLPVALPRLADGMSPPSVRFSEIHYDNVSTDTGEGIEISGPAGTDLSGWQIVLYNGSNGAVYDTKTLSGAIPATCTARGVVVQSYPSNGIQNGSPDGMALVDGGGSVVEFLSYEGTFTAVGGPADGMTSTDIGVSETSSTPVGESLQRDGSGTWSGPSASTFGACNDEGGPPPLPPPSLPATRFSELHYDNAGTDVGEAVEIEGPSGTDLTGWSVVFYNGNGGGGYATDALSGLIPALCADRGVVVVSQPGIQNGSPDGMALVDAAGTVVEFLSYEGTFTATDGPANGMTSVDIGVSEDGTDPAGESLQRDESGNWSGPSTASFGACNGQPAPPPPPPSSAPIVINEIMASPLRAAGGASWGEWFEVRNTGTDPIDLQGWTIASAGQPDHVIALSVVVPAGGYAVLGRGYDPAQNGGITIDYNYYTGSSTIWLDDADKLVLRDAAGAEVDSVQWTAGTMVSGATRALKDPSVAHADAGGSAWGYSTVPFGDGDFGTPDADNGTLSDTPPAIPNYITFSGRLSSDPPLPVGFEDQIFATLHDGTGATLSTTVTWTAVTPSLASIDGNGVMHALAAGTATFRATAEDGTTATYSLPMAVATASTTAQYGNNTEFGDPVDADPSDDYIVRRPEYTTSYNANRGEPNWVSYDLNATQFGAEDRCDCFTFDPQLPASFTRLTTNDYTGAGAAAGYGIDRGHLARSFDRTSASLDNATTFYMDNIVPQAADLNQGPWAILENYLGDLAQNQNKEVYIVAGATGNQGTLKGEGKIVIPTWMWKVALILPRGEGLADVRDYRDVQVVAVIMPNQAGVRNVDWHTYETTVDAVEALSGYDLLSLLPDRTERAVESGTEPPLGALDGPYASTEGAAIAMSAAASVDPNGSIVDYAWDFGDGTSTAGAGAATETHTYAQDGDYAVSLVVTDNDGLVDTVSTTANVANVAPAIAPLPAETLVPGEPYWVQGSFTDPGADPWSATVSYGDGTGTSALALAGQTFALLHSYCTAGEYLVRVTVSDDDVTSSATGPVTVLTAAGALTGRLTASVQALVDGGRLKAGVANGLLAKLRTAAAQLDKGHGTPAANVIRAIESEIDALANAGQLQGADAAALAATLEGIRGCVAG